MSNVCKWSSMHKDRSALKKINDNNNREETYLNTLAVLEFAKGKIATFCLVKLNSISVP